MRINPLLKEGFELISESGFRRIYGLCLLILGISFFMIIPETGPGGRMFSGGPPALFISIATVSMTAALSALVVSISRMSGRSAEAETWFSFVGGLEYALGKTAVNLMHSLIYGTVLLPFVIPALYFEALPLRGAAAAAVYLTGVFFCYTTLMEVLKLTLPGQIVIRRILLWAVFCFHLLLTSRTAPNFNPMIYLSGLYQNLEQSFLNDIIISSLKSGTMPLVFLLPVFLVLTFIRSRGKTENE